MAERRPPRPAPGCVRVSSSWERVWKVWWNRIACAGPLVGRTAVYPMLSPRVEVVNAPINRSHRAVTAVACGNACKWAGACS